MRYLILLLSLLITGPALAATPTFDAASNSGVKSNASSTASYNHTAGTLSNGIAICAVTSQDSTPGTISGVTYGGAAMTNVGTTQTIDTVTSHAFSLWYKLAPSAGASAVVATFSEVMNSHVVSCATYSNVNQSSPIGTPAAADNFDTVNPSEARVTVTSAVGEVVVAIAMFASATASGTTSHNSRASVLASSNHFHGLSDTSGAATVNMSWTLAESRNNGIYGVSLKPSTDNAGAPLFFD